MLKKTPIILIFSFLLGFTSQLWAQSSPVQYIYDALGRFVFAGVTLDF